MNFSKPLLVEVTRGSLIESTHQVDAVAVNTNGHIISSWGEVHKEIYARSALKPIQAIPLIETGAAKYFNLSPVEVALTCASHQGEPAQIKGVEGMLNKIGLDVNSLECGEQWPLNLMERHGLSQLSIEPTKLHNNCSGKHAGFLSTAIHLNEDIEGYINPEHPVQIRVCSTIAEMTDCDIKSTARGTDGCGIPVIGMPLNRLAHGMAQMANPNAHSRTRKEAIDQIMTSMRGNPKMVGGSKNVDSIGIANLNGIILKGGAEGVHIAIVPQDGIGIALKTRDGNQRAGNVAIFWILNQLGLISKSILKSLSPLLEPQIHNTLGSVVGSIHARQQMFSKNE